MDLALTTKSGLEMWLNMTAPEILEWYRDVRALLKA